MLEDIKAVPEEEYAAYIDAKKKEIVEYHLQKNSFYKNFFGKDKFSTWEEVPVMKKSDLQRPLEERFSKGFNTKNVYIGKTSGSSGHPLFLPKTAFAMRCPGPNSTTDITGMA